MREVAWYPRKLFTVTSVVVLTDNSQKGCLKTIAEAGFSKPCGAWAAWALGQMRWLSSCTVVLLAQDGENTACCYDT